MRARYEQSCPIFVISLAGAHARRATISARLQELGLAGDFWPGVDGQQLLLPGHPDYPAWKRRLFFGRDLTRGELGCVLAHRNLYRHLVEKGIERALILEDDAILADELPDVLAALCATPGSWGLVRFLGRPKNYRSMRTLVPLAGTNATLARPRGTPGGAYGYLVTLRGAQRLLDMLREVWLPIDTLHGLVWRTRLPTFAVLPSPVLPNDAIPSCIDTLDHSARWDKRARTSGWMRLLYPLTRGSWKIYLNCCVAYTWLRTWPGDVTMRSRFVTAAE